ncbi:hypothetical protein Rhe02_77890 [Rhizocola hellebori]|uniref:Glucanase n=1 Tax=Rhizocola hellebori TaxID=1392758 RepID=A0A8J3QGM9_9ACTN|nr:cellulose binding domain-containing protein [Rhizocola hellebori]GIH09722.1 hypothetical protein Rhe02_77890 [Rhizocola hellebori]
MRTHRLPLLIAAVIALVLMNAAPALAADTTPPTAPGLPVASDITEFSVTLTWPASTDDVGVDHYEVWRIHTDIIQRVATPTTNTATVTGLNRGSVSQFYVAALDAAGNRSPSSNLITVITLPGDLEPPGPVFLLSASEITDTSARLSWQGALWGEVATFRVYRGLPGGPLALVGTTTAVNPSVRTFVHTGLTPATQYVLGVSAVDAVGNASSISTLLVTTTGVAVPPTCAVSYRVTSQWAGAFNAEVRITNTASAAVTGWTLRWTFAGNQRITNLWNGALTQTGAGVAVGNLSYNATIGGSGGAQSFGFQATFTGANASPTSFTLNDRPCSIG